MTLHLLRKWKIAVIIVVYLDMKSGIILYSVVPILILLGMCQARKDDSVSNKPDIASLVSQRRKK